MMFTAWAYRPLHAHCTRYTNVLKTHKELAWGVVLYRQSADYCTYIHKTAKVTRHAFIKSAELINVEILSSDFRFGLDKVNGGHRLLNCCC